MDNVIDLGDELVVDVKYAGQVYKLREPTVGEIDKFRNVGQSGGEIGAAVIADFLVTLGMPEEVARKMGMSKATALIDGLMSVFTKKK